MRMSFKNILIFFAFACILSGCVRGDVCFSSYKHIAGDYWRHGNPQAIIYERPDSAAICMDMELLLRFYDSYEYRNIRLEISDNIADSAVFAKDTVEYLLADEFGSFAGRGWSGIYSVSLPYKAVTVSRPGKVIFIIRQIMDTDSLVGVRDVGLKGLAATCR